MINLLSDRLSTRTETKLAFLIYKIYQTCNLKDQLEEKKKGNSLQWSSDEMGTSALVNAD